MNRKFFLFVLLISTFFSCKETGCPCKLEQNGSIQNDNIALASYSDPEFIMTGKPNLMFSKHESFYYTKGVSLKARRKSVRITKTNVVVEEYLRRYFYASPNSWLRDTLLSTKKTDITPEEWSYYKRTFEENCFWSTHFMKERRILDGYQILVEGRIQEANECSGELYHVILSNQQKTPEFKAICQLMDSLILAY